MKSGPVHVLHLIDSLRIGGPGKTILNSARFIDPARFALHAAGFVDGQGLQSEFARAAARAGVPFLSLEDKRGIRYAHLRRLAGYIDAKRIRILHTHGYKTDFMGLALKTLRPGLIVLTTYHGWIRNNRRQGCLVALDLCLGRFFDGIIAVSESVMETVPAWVRAATPCRKIHNAIVLEDYVRDNQRASFRRHYRIGADETLIGVIGRLSIEKGCREILEVFSRLHRRYPRAKLMFIGEGPLQRELQERCETLGLGGKVLLTGHIRPVQPCYEGLDLLVCPSRTEGLSNVILEAMAFQVPVVATRVGGNGEIITDGHDGRLVEAGRPDALQSVIAELLGSQQAGQTLARRGHQTVRDRFDFRQRMRKVEAFYGELQRADFYGNADRRGQRTRHRSAWPGRRAKKRGISLN